MKKNIENFINDQLSRWSDACNNFRALKSVRIREMEVGGLPVKVQFNPVRIVSASADVSTSAVKARKCFLCRENRPHEQINMRFEGRKGKKYDILVNPFPIFAGHLVIASDKHTEQSIWKRYVDMLDLSKTYGGYTVFYNGPECGASAPDHLHFQAAAKGQMPLECDVDRCLDALRLSSRDISDDLRYIASVQEAELYLYSRFLRGIFVLRARTAKSMAKLFYRLLDCAPVCGDGKEPGFNLLTWYKSGEYRSAVIFRSAHRPACYFAEGDERLMISPGCAEMSGLCVVTSEHDFARISPDILHKALSEVTLDKEAEEGILWRLERTQPEISVGILSGKEIEFEILSDGAGARKAVYREGKIEYDGVLYDELFFEAQTPSMMFAEPTFVLYGVTIGAAFHWERKENQVFAGALKIMAAKDGITAVNVIGVEDYLLSVISSEMKATCSEELLKAHAVISRSWVMSMINRKKRDPDRACLSGHVPYDLPGIISYLDSSMTCRDTGAYGKKQEYIRWYDREDHRCFDVCADDHCQRYQGLTRAVGKNVRNAVDSTWGEVLTYGEEICDARFSKCCGGVTERFPTCWEDTDYPYLQSIMDSPAGSGRVFCDTSDASALSQVLNDYDLETKDFYHWTVEYDRKTLSSLVTDRSGFDIGEIAALIPVERGASGRISRLLIVGTAMSVTIGKELEIRRVLSGSHLKSSAFDVRYYRGGKEYVPAYLQNIDNGCFAGMPASELAELPDKFVFDGRGWGHGVGLCQIGAAVMASEGYHYKEILSHYYKGISVERRPV